MKNILEDLSEKIDKTSVSILREIEEVTTRLDVPFFVVGATARDIILEHQFDIKSGRATIDIDIGVFISGWDQFEALQDELIRSSRFSPSRQKQRLICDGCFPVDIIPFGAIEDKDGSITWPPDNEIQMSVAGFQECYQHATFVKLSSNPELVVKLISLTGLAILKLIAWDDNPERRSKDAIDLFLIIRHYLDAGNLDRLVNEAIDIFKVGDYEIASARFTPVSTCLVISIMRIKIRLHQTTPVLAMVSISITGQNAPHDVMISQLFSCWEIEFRYRN